MSTIKILTYTTKTDKSPFSDWLSKRDSSTKAIIRSRLDRITLGNFGDCKSIKNAKGIYELRIDYGPGYRIYFGKIGFTVVILLTAGDKGTQTRDIEKARNYWLECKELYE